VPTDLFASVPTATGGRNDMERRASTTPLRRPGTPEEIDCETHIKNAARVIPTASAGE
jgi:hypothetical protein